MKAQKEVSPDDGKQDKNPKLNCLCKQACSSLLWLLKFPKVLQCEMIDCSLEPCLPNPVKVELSSVSHSCPFQDVGVTI